MARESVSGAALITRVEKVPLRWFREVYPHLDHAQGYRPWYAVRRARVTSFGPLSLPLVSAGSVAEVVELLTFLPLISSALGTQSIILCLRPRQTFSTRCAEFSDPISCAERVRNLFAANPARTDGAWVAGELAMSTSTLKRHLAAEGFTFRRTSSGVLQGRATMHKR